jgi:hypothetical protein
MTRHVAYMREMVNAYIFHWLMPSGGVLSDPETCTVSAGAIV